jgi:hypothetical protein
VTVTQLRISGRSTANFAVTPCIWKQIVLWTRAGENLECLADTFLEFEVAFNEAKFSTSFIDKCKQSSCHVFSGSYSRNHAHGTNKGGVKKGKMIARWTGSIHLVRPSYQHLCPRGERKKNLLLHRRRSY